MSPRIGLNQIMILEEAARAADEAGLESVTLAELAKRLQVKTPSLYNHIGGLPDLRKSLAIHGLEQLRIALLNGTVGKAGEEAVLAVGRSYVGFVRQRPGLYEATLSAPDPLDPDVSAASDEILTFMLRIMDGFGLTEEKALHAVRAFRSMVHGFASLELKNGFNMALNRDQSLELMLITYLRGLALSTA
ncbi:TetR-like C-terminal domain-containing protein [Paenibacillus turpanensis]|uniref:TetR-like C-terminal domain-containing protein n=1 Tax=Paenibacillus turpanensis TaxID=2689078 RepID=UPI001409C048|nr:TetR-like C-terminal domain-containing protein [Paenibacillus turpanensis]